MEERKEGIDRASAVMPAVAGPPGRRCEARKDYRDMCSYEVNPLGKNLSSSGKERRLCTQLERGRNAFPHRPGPSHEAVNRSVHFPLSMGEDRQYY